MIVLDCSKKCSLNQFLKFFFISASGADIILLIFIAGSNRNGLQTKKCWFAFLGLIIETPTKRPANEFDSTWIVTRVTNKNRTDFTDAIHTWSRWQNPRETKYKQMTHWVRWHIHRLHHLQGSFWTEGSNMHEGRESCILTLKSGWSWSYWEEGHHR